MIRRIPGYWWTSIDPWCLMASTALVLFTSLYCWHSYLVRFTVCFFVNLNTFNSYFLFYYPFLLFLLHFKLSSGWGYWNNACVCVSVCLCVSQWFVRQFFRIIYIHWHKYAVFGRQSLKSSVCQYHLFLTVNQSVSSNYLSVSHC